MVTNGGSTEIQLQGMRNEMECVKRWGREPIDDLSTVTGSGEVLGTVTQPIDANMKWYGEKRWGMKPIDGLSAKGNKKMETVRYWRICYSSQETIYPELKVMLEESQQPFWRGEAGWQSMAK